MANHINYKNNPEYQLITSELILNHKFMDTTHKSGCNRHNRDIKQCQTKSKAGIQQRQSDVHYFP